jgi:glycosyltransferase involved in cell wall biosynthesis
VNPPVHQLLAALSPGDAIGNEALAIQRHLRSEGFESDIFAEMVHPRLAHKARPLWEYARVSSAKNVCLFHFSIGSAAGPLIFHAPDRLVLIYHNITPARFFLGFHKELTRLCHEGRRELAAFAPRAELALGDSEFNRRELEAAGFERTGVLPVAVDLGGFSHKPRAPVVTHLYRDGRTNILFVGRIIPNKGVHDLIGAFALYQRHFDRQSRLLLVGDSRGHERYLRRLQEMVEDLHVSEVVFAGHVDEDDLGSYYSLADLYLCLSAHEGFCVPLLEAMSFGIPVVAYAAGAVPETLGGEGILLEDKDPAAVAEVLDRLRHDPSLRDRVKAGQERRLEAFVRGGAPKALLERLGPLIYQKAARP